MSKICGYSLPQIRDAIEKYGYVEVGVAKALLDEVETYRAHDKSVYSKKVWYIELVSPDHPRVFVGGDGNADWYWVDVDEAREYANLYRKQHTNTHTILHSKVITILGMNKEDTDVTRG